MKCSRSFIRIFFNVPVNYRLVVGIMFYDFKDVLKLHFEANNNIINRWKLQNNPLSSRGAFAKWRESFKIPPSVLS